jgi:hypothetical protein
VFCDFRRVVLLFHSQLFDAYSKVDVSTPQAKRRYSYMFQNLNVLANVGIVLLIRVLNGFSITVFTSIMCYNIDCFKTSIEF